MNDFFPGRRAPFAETGDKDWTRGRKSCKLVSGKMTIQPGGRKRDENLRSGGRRTKRRAGRQMLRVPAGNGVPFDEILSGVTEAKDNGSL